LKRNKRGSGQLVKWLVVLRRRSAAGRVDDDVETAARLVIMQLTDMAERIRRG
jgi:hypothetical protein